MYDFTETFPKLLNLKTTFTELFKMKTRIEKVFTENEDVEKEWKVCFKMTLFQRFILIQ